MCCRCCCRPLPRAAGGGPALLRCSGALPLSAQRLHPHHPIQGPPNMRAVALAAQGVPVPMELRFCTHKKCRSQGSQQVCPGALRRGGGAAGPPSRLQPPAAARRRSLSTVAAGAQVHSRPRCARHRGRVLRLPGRLRCRAQCRHHPRRRHRAASAATRWGPCRERAASTRPRFHGCADRSAPSRALLPITRCRCLSGPGAQADSCRCAAPLPSQCPRCSARQTCCETCAAPRWMLRC